MKNLENICALIPAYNEEKTISNIVTRTKNYVNDVYVLDDGSRDKTSTKALEGKAILIQHKTKLGKINALKTGINYLLNKNYDAIITLDADGQHLPEEIPLFVKKINEGYDAIIGKRDFNGKNVPSMRKNKNLLFGKLLAKINKTDIYDFTNGFRIFNTHTLYDFFQNLNGKNYTEPELILKLIKNNYKVGSVDISTIYFSERKPKIRLFRDHIYYSLKLCAKSIINKI